MPEYGPYEQPGWPSTLPYFKPAETFRNAFAIGSEINRRKQQLENQMMAMSLRAQQNEIMNELRVADFQRKLEQGDQRLEMAQQAMNLKDTIFQWKQQKDKDTMDDIGNLAQGLGEISLDPADPGRPNAIMDVISRNARGAKAAPFLVKDAFGNYNMATRAVRNKFSADYNDFIKEVKNSAGRGQITDLNLIYNLDQWKPQWKDKHGNTIAPPADEKAARAQGSYPTGSSFTKVPSSVPNAEGIWVTIPTKKLTDLNQRLKELDQRHSKLPDQVNNEYATAVPTGSSGLSPQDVRMLNWARSHPGDPNAAKIKAKLGVDE